MHRCRVTDLLRFDEGGDGCDGLTCGCVVISQTEVMTRRWAGTADRLFVLRSVFAPAVTLDRVFRELTISPNEGCGA